MAEETPPGEPRALKPRQAVLRGLARRCPLCGQSGTFTGWFAQRERCPTCNFPTTRVVDQWIGALGINTMVTFTLLVGYLVAGFVFTHPDPPIGVLTALGLVIAGGFPILFYPVSKSLWAGIDLAMRPVDPDDDVDPRFIPRR